MRMSTIVSNTLFKSVRPKVDNLQEFHSVK
jgi:hypothetical protein